MNPQQPSQRRVSPRLVLAALLLSVVAGPAVAASAAPSVTCLLNSDSRSDGSTKGICLVLPLPDLPK